MLSVLTVLTKIIYEEIKEKKLPFRVFSHLFNCTRGSQADVRYQKCTCFYVNNYFDATKIRTFFSYDLKKLKLNQSIQELFLNTTIEDYT